MFYQKVSMLPNPHGLTAIQIAGMPIPRPPTSIPPEAQKEEAISLVEFLESVETTRSKAFALLLNPDN